MKDYDFYYDLVHLDLNETKSGWSEIRQKINLKTKLHSESMNVITVVVVVSAPPGTRSGAILTSSSTVCNNAPTFFSPSCSILLEQ